MTKSELEIEIKHWKDEVEKSLKFVEGKSYDIIAIKEAMAILLELVGRPNPPNEDE
jgi:hypothetical protein|tara:strand:+ start:2247 stop:2414 length:168 start_codon:yes stop_codon:yes gene_type:complete